MDGKLTQMAASNDDIKRGFQDLCDFLKKDPPDKNKSPGAGHSSTSPLIPRSPNSGIHSQTPTQFGNINDNLIVDNYGRIMNLNAPT